MGKINVIDDYDLKAHKDEAALFLGFAPVPAFPCRQVQARKQRVVQDISEEGHKRCSEL